MRGGWCWAGTGSRPTMVWATWSVSRHCSPCGVRQVMSCLIGWGGVRGPTLAQVVLDHGAAYYERQHQLLALANNSNSSGIVATNGSQDNSSNMTNMADEELGCSVLPGGPLETRIVRLSATEMELAGEYPAYACTRYVHTPGGHVTSVVFVQLRTGTLIDMTRRTEETVWSSAMQMAC
jgi:hypothetical protein